MTTPSASGVRAPQSFASYYNDSWRDHRNIVNRRLHFIGAGGSIIGAIMSTCAGFLPGYLLSAAFAYGCAAVGHRFIEKNKPQMPKNPLYATAAYYRQFVDVLNNRIVL